MKYKVWLTRDQDLEDYHLWRGAKPEFDHEWLTPLFSADSECTAMCSAKNYFPLSRHMKGGPKSIKCFEVTVKEVKE